MGKNIWTPEMIQFVKDNYSVIGDTELAEKFNILFPKKKSWGKYSISSKRKRLKLLHTNKHLCSIAKRNHNNGRYKRDCPIGTIKIRSSHGRKVMMIKVADPERYKNTEKDFVRLANYIWTNTCGEIPKGFIVTHLDNDPMNCELSNLCCIPLEEKTKRNLNKNLNWYAGIMARDFAWKKFLLEHPELIKLFILNNKLKREIKNAGKKG